jgi:hypothetical protein
MRITISLFALCLIAACSTQATGEAGYTLAEGVIEGPGNLTVAGTAMIDVNNIGEYSHTLVVTNESGEVVGATGLLASGEQASISVDLEAGTYVFSCRIVSQDDEGNLIDHFEQGMHRTVTVSA